MRNKGPSTGTLDNYEVELEGVTIPGISTPNDLLYVNVNVEYEATPDIPAIGMSGPPEHSSPAESGDFSILSFNIGSLYVWINGEPKNKREYDINQLSPQQQIILKKEVGEYLDNYEDEIADRVLSSSEQDYSVPEKYDTGEDI